MKTKEGNAPQFALHMFELLLQCKCKSKSDSDVIFLHPVESFSKRGSISKNLFLTHLDFNRKFFVSGKSIFVGEGQQSDLIQGIGGIRDQLSKEDLEDEK